MSRLRDNVLTCRQVWQYYLRRCEQLDETIVTNMLQLTCRAPTGAATRAPAMGGRIPRRGDAQGSPDKHADLEDAESFRHTFGESSSGTSSHPQHPLRTKSKDHARVGLAAWRLFFRGSSVARATSFQETRRKT